MTAWRRIISGSDAERLRGVLRIRGFARFVATLESELRAALIVPKAKIPPDVVTMNSRVVCVTPAGRSIEANLVYPWDEDETVGNISVLSPLGLALLGTRVGARIRAQPDMEWGVEQLLYQPEAAGDRYR